MSDLIKNSCENEEIVKVENEKNNLVVETIENLGKNTNQILIPAKIKIGKKKK